MADVLRLMGRVFIYGDIAVKTGLHIGGTEPGLNIGGVNTIIVDSLSGQPYIPGSSLKGKMRSMLEKYMALPLYKHAGVDHMHTADVNSGMSEEEAKSVYRDSAVAKIYGVPSQSFNAPTRLVVRDVQLTEASALELLDARTELPYTEIKTEVSIDRITSQANPRQVERVPAGAVFGEMCIIYNIYEYYGVADGQAAFSSPDHFAAGQDIAMLQTVFYGMALLEDDYLGGLGSRGSGQIAFENLYVTLKTGDNYRTEIPLLNSSRANPATLFGLIEGFDTLQAEIRGHLGVA